MAKICTQCNLKYSSKALKCVQCGSELEVIQADLKRKRIFIGILAGVLSIALILGAILVFTGPKAKVRGIMRAFRRGDVDAVIETFPDFLLESVDLSEEYLKIQLPDAVTNLSENKFSYNISKIASPSSKEKNSVLEHLDKLGKYGYNPSKLQDIKVAIFTMKGITPGKWYSSFDKFILIKYDGVWYWWPFYYN